MSPRALLAAILLPLAMDGGVLGQSRQPNTPSQDASPVATEPGPATTEEEALSDLNLDTPGFEKVKAAAAAHDMAAVKAAYLDYRRNGSSARWFLLARDTPQETAPLILPRAAPSKAVAADDPAANQVLAHHLWYDHKTVEMGRNFDWLLNPLPRSDPAFTDEWTYTVVRMEFWQTLADAYWKTRQEKYATEWVAEMEDFVAKNPPAARTEPSLWRTLDTAVRMAYAWPDAYFHFLGSPAFTPEAQWIYLRSLHDHALVLQRELENPAKTGNWVTTECFGLYTMAALFPEFREAEKWRQMALERLGVEINRMVPPDGFEAELTPSYHCVALHGFLGVYLMAALNHFPFPEPIKAKLFAMYRALILVMDPTGNDVSTNDSWGITSAVARAREGLLLLGDDPLLKWAASGGKEGTAPPASTMLPYAGFYTMRGGWDPADFFLFFRGGPTGIGHEHEDMLEVTLNAWGHTLLFDPGGYPYDHSDWRRFTLGTASHNTIIVDGKWQHRGPSGLPVPPVHNPWCTTPVFDYAAATYAGGYEKNDYVPGGGFERWGPPDFSVRHTRRVLFLKPSGALVLDTLEGTGHHVFEAHFNIDAPAATLDPATQAAFSQAEDDIHLGVYPLERDHLVADIVQGQKNPLLGWFPNEHRPIPTVRFRKEQDAPAIFATFLHPYRGAAPAFSASPLAAQGDGLWAGSLKTSAEDTEIVMAKDSAPHEMAFRSAAAGDVRARAAVLVLRHSTGGGVSCSGGYDLTEYQDQYLSFSASAPCSVAWIGSGRQLLVFNADTVPCTLSFTAPRAPQQVLLPPGIWTEISAAGAVPAPTPPRLFAPLEKLTSGGRF